MIDSTVPIDAPSVARVRVTLALLSVLDADLSIATQLSPGIHLPSHLPRTGSSLDQVARTMLTELTGSDAGYLEQLYTFSFERDELAEIVVSYLALAPDGTLLTDGATWQQANANSECLSPSDRVVLDYALIRLQAKIGYTTIAFHLMPESFSLTDLQQTYETILDRPLDPRNFRRRMVSSGLLQAENRLRREGSHRPAALYRFAGNHDPGSYLTPSAPQVGEQRES